MTHGKKALLMLIAGLCISLGISIETGWPRALWLVGTGHAAVCAFTALWFDDSERMTLARDVSLISGVALVIALWADAGLGEYAALVIQSALEIVMAAAIPVQAHEEPRPHAKVHIPSTP